MDVSLEIGQILKKDPKEATAENPFFDKLASLLVRIAFVFEPLFAALIALYLGRRLRSWKNKGLVTKYAARTKRTAKLEYEVEVRLVLTSHQIGQAVIRLIKTALNLL